MAAIIARHIPTEPVSFVDVVDDDGQGNGPFEMKLTVWREGEKAFFDWTGTDPQAPGPINLATHEGMFKMFVGIYLIMAFDPEISFNEGFHDLIEVILEPGSLVSPEFPAPLGLLNITLARHFDVIQGVLALCAPEFAAGAGYGSSPALTYSGTDDLGEYFPARRDQLRGAAGPPGRRRHGRALLVAAVHQHPHRVHRELFPGDGADLSLDPRQRRGRRNGAAATGWRRCTASTATVRSRSRTTAGRAGPGDGAEACRAT